MSQTELLEKYKAQSTHYFENALGSIQAGEAGKAGEFLWGSVAEALKAVNDPAKINVEDARKLVVSGMEQERRALGIEGGATQNLTQINIGPKTSVDKL